MNYTANPVQVEAFKITHVEKSLIDGVDLMLEDGTTRNADSGMIARYVPVEGDYWVIQSDGYVYVNPREVFERKYSPTPVPLESFFDFLLPADEPVIEGMELAEVVYGAGQKEYVPLRTLPSNGPERRVLSRWTLNPDQREALSKGGDIYLELLTFGQPLQPIRMAIGYKPLPEFVMRLMWPYDQPKSGQGTESDQKQ